MTLESLRDAQHEAIVYWLNRLDENWQKIDWAELPETKLHGAFCCVYSGVVQMRARFTCSLISIGVGVIERTAEVEALISGWWNPNDVIHAAKETIGVAPLGFEWGIQLDDTSPIELRIRAEFLVSHSKWLNGGDEVRKNLVFELRNLAANNQVNGTKPEIIIRLIANTTIEKGISLPTVETVPADGPHAPNRIIFNGKTETVQPLTFKLIAYMWSRPEDKPARVDIVAESMWGVNNDWDDRRLATQLSKATKALANLNVPWSLSRVDEFIVKT